MAKSKLPRQPGQSKLIDITGQRFGRWTVLSRDLSRGIKPVRWLCQCDCDATKSILSTDLRSGGSRSCGCLSNELKSNRSKTHGKTKTPTHVTWAAMLTRCTNENSDDFHHYGGRGITACKRWSSFEAFLEDMGERPAGMTLDRKDNSKGYCKENCQWVTQKRQARNTRRTVFLTHEGQTKPLIDWCEELGVNYNCARDRLKKGWPSHKILATEPFKTGPIESPFKGKPRPNILRDSITKRFCGAKHGS